MEKRGEDSESLGRPLSNPSSINQGNDEHTIPLEELYARLKSSSAGLTSAEAAIRAREQGENILISKKKTSLIIKFISQFSNFFAILLLIGGVLAFIADFISPGQNYDYIGIALIGVVMINSIFTFYMQYRSERIMASFRRMLPDKVKALREGQIVELSAKELVPGDIMILAAGDKVPADCRIIEENTLKVDNSSLTGESEPQLRTLACTHDNILESRNMAFSGTLVQSGDGKALVYATGMRTQIGKIVQLTKETQETDTPLHKELRRFSSVISAIALIIGVIFFVIGLFIGESAIGSLIFAIGIIVANVPEGMLPTVTLCLSIAAKRMAKKNALIKNLESVETLGSTTVICTDKTGTLTQNKMVLNTLMLNNEEHNVHEKNISQIMGMQEVFKTMILCNNATLKSASQGFIGDPTETALMAFAERHISIQDLAQKNRRMREFPFDSKTKRMITFNQDPISTTAFMKGAPEIVLASCAGILINGRIIALTAQKRKDILRRYEKLASRGERVLAFALKRMKNAEKEAQEKNFLFIGLAGLLDPPRHEVHAAIAKCAEAGIKVIMITGDYRTTAEAISRQIGLTRGTPNIFTGQEIDSLDEEELKGILRKDNLIFARTNPMHKLRIVKCLQSMGEVVTVTGDGVNDAPALKNADMGVAMGVSGTEVAKEASDMILLDDSFATIISAIEEGRTIFENIKKFVSYILTSNVPEIMPFIAFVLLGIPLPLTVILILSIDLGTDLIPAIGLGSERTESDVMKQRPKKRSEHLLTPSLLFTSYGILGMIQAAAGFFSYFFILFNGGWSWGEQLAMADPLYLKAVTAFFASIVICQMVNVMINRTQRQSLFYAGLLKNRVVLLGISIEIAFLAAITSVPALRELFGTHQLGFTEYMLPIPFALLMLAGSEMHKFLLRKGNRFAQKISYARD